MSDKEIKLQIATQCLLAMLSNSSEHASSFMNILAKNAWDVATKLVKLSEQEEEEKK